MELGELVAGGEPAGNHLGFGGWSDGASRLVEVAAGGAPALAVVLDLVFNFGGVEVVAGGALADDGSGDVEGDHKFLNSMGRWS